MGQLAMGLPKWKPQFGTLRRCRSSDFITRKKTIRNAASNYISKPDVRDYIFRVKGSLCYICGEPATQIDHKISALQFATDTTLNIWLLNSEENLFPICAHCNYVKTP